MGCYRRLVPGFEERDETTDQERPEPELSWPERRAERRRLKVVRRDRRRQMAASSKDRKNQGKTRKKAKKGK